MRNKQQKKHTISFIPLESSQNTAGKSSSRQQLQQMQALNDKYKCSPENKIMVKIRSDAHENNQVFTLYQVLNCIVL